MASARTWTWLCILFCGAAVAALRTTARADTATVAALKANDLVYDPVSRMIYASVPSSAGSGGNSITPLDPSTGAIGTAVPIGNEPGKLALSSDGQALYVALDGDAAVARFNVPTRTAAGQFTLGTSGWGPYYPEDLEVVPGSPNSVAVSRKLLGLSPRQGGVLVYDNGVPRAAQGSGSNVIEFSHSPSVLYGYNNETTEFGFRSMSVDSGGVAVTNITESVISGFGVDFKFAGGRVYTTTGLAFDPVERRLAGSFPLPGSSSGYSVEPDPAHGRVFYLGTASSTVARIAVFDIATFRPLGFMTFSGLSGAPGSLIRWGDDGLAFRTTGGQVFLARSPFVATSAPVADLSVTCSDDPDPVVAGTTFTYTVQATNRGPDAAANVVVSDTLPAGASFVGAVTTRGASPTFSSGVVTCQVGNLANGESVTVTITARPTVTGVLTNVARASSSQWDSDASNDQAQEATTVNAVYVRDRVAIVTLPTNDLVSDPANGLLYASVPGSAGAAGNSIVPIDPYLGDAGAPAFLGSEPGALAVSGDGLYVYAALNGAGAVGRMVTTTMQPDVRFWLGNDGGGAYFAEDLASPPGQPEALAVSRMYRGLSPRHAGVAVFDNGIQRALTTPGHTGANRIEFATAASQLYGYNNETTEFGFRRMAVDAGGVSVLDTTQNLISGFGVDFEIGNGFGVSTTGRVFDPQSRTLLGTCTLPSGASSVSVEVDAILGRAFFLLQTANGWGIYAYSLSSFQMVGSVALPGVQGTATSLVRWGPDGLAFRTTGGQVYLVQAAAVRPSFLQASPSSVAPGASLTVTWSEMPGRPWSDWIGLFRVGDASTAALWWNYVGNSPSRSFTLLSPTPPGQYEFRYFLNNGYTEVGRSNPVTVTGGTYTLTPSATSVSTGAPLSISWTSPAGSAYYDWIGLFKVGDPNTASAWWRFTMGATSGTLDLTAPPISGDYEFRYLLNNGYSDVARSVKVTVGSSAGSYTLTPSVTSVTTGAPLAVSWTAPSGSAYFDWVGLYRVGDANTSYLWWSYTNGAASGTRNLTAPSTPGDYEFRYFLNNDYTDLVRSAKVTVTESTSGPYTVTPSTSSVARGGALSVSWTAPAGSSSTDWVGLYRVTDPNTAYISWSYTNGTTSGSWSLTAPTTAGNYEFRYLLNNGYTDVARSVKVTVN